MSFAKQNLENCTLKQLTNIRDNQFRSVDNSVDYCPFEVESRIIEIEMRNTEKQLKAYEAMVQGNDAFLEIAKQDAIDPQLIALMEVQGEKGRALLSMITNKLLELTNTKAGIATDKEIAERKAFKKHATNKPTMFSNTAKAPKWPINKKGSVNRGGLKKLLIAGLLEARCDYRYTDDYAWDNASGFGKTDWLPAVYSDSFVDGKASFSDWDFKTQSGGAWLDPQNKNHTHFSIHSNESWTFRFKQ